MRNLKHILFGTGLCLTVGAVVSTTVAGHCHVNWSRSRGDDGEV
jgi:hypothetical protein